MICNHHIGIRPAMAVGVGVGVRVGVGLPPMPENTGGGAKAVEQYLLIPSTIGLETLTAEDIAQRWRSIYANPSAVPAHNSQELLTITTDKQGSALEQQYDIADTIHVVTMSSQEIKDKFNDIYQTLR